MNATHVIQRLSRVLALALLLAAAPASAQSGRWLIGLDAVASFIGENEDAADVTVDEAAGGLALQIGYLLAPGFMLRLHAAAADHPTSDAGIDLRFGGGTIDAVLLLRAGPPVRPYLFGGLGGFAVESRKANLVYETRGPGMAFGGGVHALLGERVSLHGALRFEWINWDQSSATYELPGGGTTSIVVPIDESGSAAKISLGIGIWL